MTSDLSSFLDGILGVDGDNEPPATVRRARASIAARLGLLEPGAGLPPPILSAYIAKTLDARGRERIHRRLACDADARADLAFAMDLLADIEVARSPRQVAETQGEAIDPPHSRCVVQAADLFREIGDRMRRVRGQVIEIMTDLVAGHANAWTFDHAPAFATRGPAMRTVVAEGVGTADGSSIKVMADREDASCFVSVVVRDYPGGRPPPALTLTRYRDGVPDQPLPVELEIDRAPKRAGADLFYEAHLPDTDCCAILMEGADGTIVLAALVVLSP